MRVIRTKGSDGEQWTPRLCTHDGQPYAILSHRWLPQADNEVLFSDIEEVDRISDAPNSGPLGEPIRNPHYVGKPPNAKLGFPKLQGAARQALADGYDYVWVDACCIDKSSSAELSEAINSMWKWYKSSAQCYVYLSDVQDATGKEQYDAFKNSEWWTRGWTLQELLAPRELTFFSRSWSAIGRKKDMDLTISDITGIDDNIINGTISLDSVCIAQRMSWSSARVTSRIEDRAYSLMGLFSVNMALLYGEGENAFLRLQQEIMKDSDDESIFAWKDEQIPPYEYSGLLAVRPSAFASCSRTVRYQDSESRASYSMTNKGLSIKLWMQGGKGGSSYTAWLHCADPASLHKNITISLVRITPGSNHFARVECNEWVEPSLEDSGNLMKIFVKQSHDQQPAYQQLGEINSSIRLLRVVPTESTHLQVRLIEADIVTSRYTAISYNWGDIHGRRCPIRVNSDVFEVSGNVYDLLQKVRRELRDELFWIDAICIRMDDMMERNHQIFIMKQIFSHATKVVAWLGGVDAKESALRSLAYVGRPAREKHDGLIADWAERKISKQKLPADLTALVDIATHEYWTRVWIMQELYVARRVTIEGDAFAVSVADLTDAHHAALRIADRSSLWSDDDGHDLSFMAHLLSICPTTHEHGHLSTKHQLLTPKPELMRQPIDLETLLARFQHQKCTARHDRIYGLIGMTDLAGVLPMDYSKSVLEVFWDVADCLAESLTWTILPMLSRALDLTKSDLAILHEPRSAEASYELLVHASVAKTALRSGQDIYENVAKIATDSSEDDHGRHYSLIIGANSTSRTGLFFSRMGEPVDYIRPPSYRLSHKYVYSPTGELQLTPLDIPNPEFLSRFIITIDATDALLQKVRISTDQIGLIILAYCLDSSNSRYQEPTAGLNQGLPPPASKRARITSILRRKS